MARVYLIGGAPRVGKSTLALKLQSRHRVVSISTDALRAKLRETITPIMEPDLYYLDSLNANETAMANQMRSNTHELIAAADRESTIVWSAVHDFISRHLLAGHDVLVEGVAVLPQTVAQLPFEYSVVHLGNQAPDHVRIIEQYALNHPDTWLGTLNPDTVAAFGEFSGQYSRHAQSQALKFNQTYIEMSEKSFPESLHQALSALMPPSR